MFKYDDVFILMYKNEEILSFGVNYKKRQVHVIKIINNSDKTPKGIDESLDEKSKDYSLRRFINHRCIPDTRTDYEEIIKATGYESGFELSFRAHGLSLSSHYWYKKENETLRYEDINFFTNKWDDSFARAVLSQDYEKLKHCDLNVPDLATSGWGAKGWILEDDGPKLYKLGINKDHNEEALGEVLASKIARKLINEDEVLEYKLKKWGNRYASVSPVMINIDEDLFPLSEYLSYSLYFLYRGRSVDKSKATQFFERIKESDIPGLYVFFIKQACLRDLCFVSDLHFENISLIRNSKTGQIRIAPIYDLGGAFGSSRSGQNIISKPNKAMFIMIYYLFSNLDPNWDYSWYDPAKLIGVEEEIKETLSKSSFYTPEIIDCIIQVYNHQKEALDQMASMSANDK